MKLVDNDRDSNIGVKVVTKAINHSVPKVKITVNHEKNIVEGRIYQRY